MDYAKYEPKLDHLFQTALRQGKEALEELYQSPEWNNFTERYTDVVIKDFNLKNIHLQSLSIQGVILDNAQFDHVQFTNVALETMQAWNAIFKNCQFNHCPGSIAHDDKFPFLSNYIDVRNSTWDHITFQDMDLRHWILGGGKFSHITAENVILPTTKSQLIQLLQQSKFTEFNDRRYEQVPSPEYLDLRHADLSNIDFRGSNIFEELDLRFANLSNTNLSGETVGLCDFSYANLQNANLSNTQLGASLYFADLRGANLTGSILQTNQGITNASHFFQTKLDPGVLESLDIYPIQQEKPRYNPKTYQPRIPAWNGFSA